MSLRFNWLDDFLLYLELEIVIEVVEALDCPTLDRGDKEIAEAIMPVMSLLGPTNLRYFILSFFKVEDVFFDSRSGVEGDVHDVDS